MARIIRTIEIEGQQAVALFDTGATYSYVRSPLVRQAPRRSVTRPARVTLGGKDIDIRELCLIEGKIEGLDFFADAVAVEEIGRADGQELDALIGALTMERWEIRLDPKTGALDLEGLRRREFMEFLSGRDRGRTRGSPLRQTTWHQWQCRGRPCVCPGD